MPKVNVNGVSYSLQRKKGRERTEKPGFFLEKFYYRIEFISITITIRFVSFRFDSIRFTYLPFLSGETFILDLK